MTEEDIKFVYTGLEAIIETASTIKNNSDLAAAAGRAIKEKAQELKALIKPNPISR